MVVYWEMGDLNVVVDSIVREIFEGVVLDD